MDVVFNLSLLDSGQAFPQNNESIEERELIRKSVRGFFRKGFWRILRGFFWKTNQFAKAVGDFLVGK